MLGYLWLCRMRRSGIFMHGHGVGVEIANNFNSDLVSAVA